MQNTNNPTIQETPLDPTGRSPHGIPAFRLFFDCSPVPTVIIEENGMISRANTRFLEVCGYTRADVEGKKHWKDFVAAQDFERLAGYHREILKPQGWAPPVSTFGFVRKDQSSFPAMLSVRRVHGTTQVIAAFSDCSVQKKLEGLLRNNEERYRRMVNNLSLGLFKTRPESPGKCLWANPALIQMYGYDSLSDFAKVPILDHYTDPGDRERFMEELDRNGRVMDFEVLNKKKDGAEFWVRITAFPKKRADGTIEWIEGNVQDINECKVAITTCEASNTFLREMADAQLGVGLIGTDPDGTITFFNKSAEHLLGYGAEEVTGKTTPLLFFSETELAGRGRTLTEEAGRPVTGFEVLSWPLTSAHLDEQEWTFLKNDGDAITVNAAITRLRAGENGDGGFLIAIREITDKMLTAERFRSSALQMSGVIYNLPDPTFAIDREGKVIAWNRAMEDLTGIAADEILGKGDNEYAVPFYGRRRPMLIDLIGEPDEKIEEWGYREVKRKGNAVSAESPAADEENNLVVLWTIAAPIFDQDGERAGAIESLADITERRKKETALEDTVLKFREILDNTGSATAIIEEDGTISFINPEFERLLGYVRDEVEGKKKWDEFVVPEDIRGMQDEWMKADLQDGPVRNELRFIRWDGEVRNGYLTITRIPGTHKIVVALLDITDKIRAEQAVQEANRKLNFLNGITRHDILNQLTVLKANIEMTKEETTDAGQSAVLDKELAAVEAIQSLITFTRDYQDIGIEPAAWQVLSDVIAASCTGIRLGDISLEVEIHGVEIFADLLIKRVFADLIKNAIEHGKKTKKIRIYCVESFEELHVICEDDGIGVLPECKEKIFSREFFIKAGLDMYLAREILSITGIGIRETGVYGQGAEFEIRVPKGGYRFTEAQP